MKRSVSRFLKREQERALREDFAANKADIVAERERQARENELTVTRYWQWTGQYWWLTYREPGVPDERDRWAQQTRPMDLALIELQALWRKSEQSA